MGTLWYSVFVTLASSAVLRMPSRKTDLSANPTALIQPSISTTTTFLPTITPLSSSYPIPNSHLILDCFPQSLQLYPPTLVAQVFGRAFVIIHQLLSHGDRLVGRRFEVNMKGLQLLVTTPADQSPLPSSRLYFSELETLLGGFGMVLNTQGFKRTKCDYRREQPPDPWLGVIELDNVA